MLRSEPNDLESLGFTRVSYSNPLLVPDIVVRMIQDEREAIQSAEREAAIVEVAAFHPDSSGPESETAANSEPYLPATYSVPIFSEMTIKLASEGAKRRDSETRQRMKDTLALLSRRGGQRLIPDIEVEVIEAISTTLRKRFPNFGRVIDYLETELLVAMASSPETFRIPPLLIHGGPGIGKTAFAMALANLLGVGFDKVSAAGMQGSFEITGTSSHWATSGTGRVFDLLATGDYATPVLMIDEIDKMQDDDRNPIVPAFLELLEPVSAREFVDQSLNLRFDASKLIIIATANDITAISEPLLTRLHAIEVSSPTALERRQIAGTIAREMIQGLVKHLEVEERALDHLATANVDIREIGRLLRKAIGRAIRKDKDYVGLEDICLPTIPPESRIGFV
jgi:ATP-dependent Lon protease